jgi:hypothetical protein
MPDTGAPWNIPYVAPTDVVRDYPTADEAQALAIAAGLTAAGVGIGTNAVQAVRSDAATISLAAGAESASNEIEVTITPSSATSKVLLIAHVHITSPGETVTGDTSANITLYRSSTAVGIGAAAGSRKRVTAAAAGGQTRGASVASMTFLDSPATDLAVTYGVRFSHNSTVTRSLTLNRTLTDTDNDTFSRYISTLTAIEVAA